MNEHHDTGGDRDVRRFPARLSQVGAEPGPRFTLATKRILLAQIRTLLALVAGGRGRSAFPRGLRVGMSAGWSALGTLVSRWGRESARPARIARWRHAHWLVVGTVCFGAFMGQLDASIVTLAFPALQQQFDTSLAEVEWVSLAYLLTLVALLAPIGRLSDASGRKRWYLYGFALFTVASALCGLAPTLGALVGFRVLQAVGAAMLQANSVALVTTSVPRASMRSALGVQAAAQALGLALGPTVGGLLVTGPGWRWVFLVNIPVGVAGIIAGRFLLPRTRARTPVGSFDGAGLVLLVVWTTALLLAASAVSGLSLPGWVPGLLAALFVAGAVAFVARERVAASPLIDLHLVGNRMVGCGILAAMGGYLVLFGPLVLFPVVLTRAGESAAHAGLVCTALPVGFAVGATLVSRLLPASWSSRRRCVLGAGLCVVALVVLVIVGGRQIPLIILLAILGLGVGVFTPANNHMVMASVPTRMSGLGGGILNMSRGLGTALGVAVVTFALHAGSTLSGERAALVALALAALMVGFLAAGAAGRRQSENHQGMRRGRHNHLAGRQRLLRTSGRRSCPPRRRALLDHGGEGPSRDRRDQLDPRHGLDEDPLSEGGVR